MHEEKLGLFLCALTQGKHLCSTQGCNPFPEHMRDMGCILFSKKPLQANLSDEDFWMAIPHQKETHKQWSHVTRFKNWKTSLRREVITGSTHPRQATEWLANIDRAKSMQDVDEACRSFYHFVKAVRVVVHRDDFTFAREGAGEDA